MAVQQRVLKFGAVAARLDVFADFLSYTNGVYFRKSGVFVGVVGVQILGWGVDPKTGLRYWILELPFGPAWGEDPKFLPCKHRDVLGPFASTPPSTCVDSALWRDDFGRSCAWYEENDPKCMIFMDRGQRTNCKAACRRCTHVANCGYARVALEGTQLYSHALVAAYTPTTAEISGSSSCIDDDRWVDSKGRTCRFYAANPDACSGTEGQQTWCAASCGQNQCCAGMVGVAAVLGFLWVF